MRGAFLCPRAHWRNPAQRAYMRGLNFNAKDKMMADAETLTLTLSTGGDVVIKLRPTWRPAMSSASPAWPATASTTASCSTA